MFLNKDVQSFAGVGETGSRNAQVRPEVLTAEVGSTEVIRSEVSVGSVTGSGGRSLELKANSTHTPRKCTHVRLSCPNDQFRWRKQLRKVSMLFSVPRNSYWPQSMHEPVTAALICPLLHSRPW
jgi:hypothetical protein